MAHMKSYASETCLSVYYSLHGKCSYPGIGLNFNQIDMIAVVRGKLTKD